MKRLYTYVSILCTIVLACLSCEKEPLQTNSGTSELLEVPEEEVVVSGNQGTHRVTVLTNFSFTAAASVSWIKCVVEDHKTLRLEIDKNTTITDRVATIDVKIRDDHFDVSYSKTFQVRQTRGNASVEAYFIDPFGWNGPTKTTEMFVWKSVGETLTMHVKSNTEYTISSDCDWLTWGEATSNSDGVDDIEVVVSRNSEVNTDGRTGHIYVSAEDVKSTVTIYQSSFSPSMIIDSESSEIDLSYAATTTNIEFTSNTSWKASCDAGWISLKKEEEIFDNQDERKSCVLPISVQENTNGGKRSATITIESVESSYKLKIVATINQDGLFAISNVQTRYLYTADDYLVYLEAQRNWVATCNAEWLSLIETNGSVMHTYIRFKLEENSSEKTREAVVTVTATDDSELHETFTIVQDPISTIYYYATSSLSAYDYKDYINTNANVVTHFHDKESKFGRIIYDRKVTSIEGRLSSNGYYPRTWGYATTSVILPPTITTIGNHVFNSCSNLTRIDLPASVTHIAEEAIHGCSKVTAIYCEAVNPPTGASGMFLLTNSDCKIYVPTESVNAYKAAPYWSDYADKILGYNF